MDEVFSTKEVAGILKLTKQTVQNWCKSGRIKAVKLPGGSYRISKDEVERIQHGDESSPTIIDTSDMLKTPSFAEETYEDEIFSIAQDISKRVKPDNRISVEELQRLARFFRAAPDDKTRNVGYDLSRLAYSLQELVAKEEKESIMDIDMIVSHFIQFYPNQILGVISTLTKLQENLRQAWPARALEYVDVMTDLIDKLQMAANKIDEDRRRTFLESQGKEIEDILKSDDLLSIILEGFHTYIVGNDDVLTNLIYDLCLVGANLIELRTKTTVIKKIRSHPAIWLYGPAGSGKGQIITLIEKISYNSHRVSSTTPTALKKFLAQAANFGSILVPEADAIYRETRRGNLPQAQMEMSSLIRQIIEDNSITYTEYDPASRTYTEVPYSVDTTIIMAATYQPREAQMRQRFMIYPVEHNLGIDAHIMGENNLGVVRRAHEPYLSLSSITFLYATITENAMNMSGVMIPDRFLSYLDGISYRLLLLSAWMSNNNLRDDIDDMINVPDENVSSAVTQESWMSFISMDLPKDKEYPSFVRRQNDIFRRIVASCYLNYMDREIDNGYLRAKEEDVMAGIKLLTFIETTEKASVVQLDS